MDKNRFYFKAFGILSLVIVMSVFAGGCTAQNAEDAITFKEAEDLIDQGSEKIFSINWNSENPVNIRSKLSSAEVDFKIVFDSLSLLNPENFEETKDIYAMRAISCANLELISSLMDLSNVIEHYNNADYYASTYEKYNWEMEIKTADSALASARNKLNSAITRLNGINMNEVPFDMQGEITGMKVQYSGLNRLMGNLATEFSEALD
ncbi:hypothetical protein [Methanoplanus endosymbiosus]|uniref:Lipoprotein n=1 Tax=Methanoplanus endosymbiosus TaxID=33865 RepID=A0A9E7TKR9_9EURY|nr:hypothetical protein [Methanoplanus endosymbiosus]UUX92925.1 hypothetical protein L6E24_02010 [Methanoplanus endosymbiosus]